MSLVLITDCRSLFVTRDRFMKGFKKIIIKVGTSTLTQGTQKLSRRHILTLVQQIAHLRSQGFQIVLVSSGAVATGRDLVTSCSHEQRFPSKQVLASIGQVRLMQVWAELFALFDLQVGQVLLTRDDFSEGRRSLTEETIHCLLQHGIIPIINENDVIATKEVRIGDNDNLAAFVAELLNADSVILLTDQEGLFTANPRFYPDAKLIPVVEQVDEAVVALGGESSTSLGTGGMATKIQAAQVASKSGIRTIIASSSHPNVLIDLAEGKQIGTLFLEQGKTV
jgi:glutamate 5-kinase